MSHELTERANGLVEFAYRADHGLPWHGLGQAVPETDYHNADAWTRHSGMDWDVKRTNVRYGVKNQRTIEDQHVLYRSDTGDHLCIVSDGYKIVQPGQMLGLFRDVAKAGGLEISAAGTLRGGQVFWATAKIGEASPVAMRDKVGAYVLITSSADGSRKTTAARRVTRAVCANTIAMAAAEGPAEIAISHRSVFDPSVVREWMGHNVGSFAAFKAQLVRLANKRIDDNAAEVLTMHALAKVALGKPLDADKVRETAGFAKIMSLFQGDAIGSSFDGVRNTAWGLLNATTEYADHHVRAQSDENRLVSAQWGSGADLKDRMFEMLQTV